MSIRTLIERLSRHIVVKRRLPAKFGRGPLFVSPAAALSYWRLDLGKVDRMLLDVAFEHVRAGDVVWDIGANVGLFAFAAANLSGATGRVLAVEPDIWLANILRRSAGMDENRRLKVDVLPVAVTNAVDLREFNIAMRGRASNYLATSIPSPMAGGVRETQLVPTVTLDWLLARYLRPPGSSNLTWRAPRSWPCRLLNGCWQRPDPLSFWRFQGIMHKISCSFSGASVTPCTMPRSEVRTESRWST